jgi:hypothetical protein
MAIQVLLFLLGFYIEESLLLLQWWFFLIFNFYFMLFNATVIDNNSLLCCNLTLSLNAWSNNHILIFAYTIHSLHASFLPFRAVYIPVESPYTPLNFHVEKQRFSIGVLWGRILKIPWQNTRIPEETNTLIFIP